MIIKDIRKSKGLSLRAMAKELKCSPTYLDDVENGRRKLTPKIISSFVHKFWSDVNQDQIRSLISECFTEEVINRYFETELPHFGNCIDEETMKNLLAQRFFYIMTGVKELT